MSEKAKNILIKIDAVKKEGGRGKRGPRIVVCSPESDGCL